MHKNYLIILLITTLSITALSKTYAQVDTMKVLFLGNSFTNSNNLSSLFEQFAIAAGKTVLVDENTPGGYTLSMHLTNPSSLQKINSQDWDYVVLQEQSQIPSWIPERDTLMFPYAIALDSIIHAHHLCTKTLFFMTWAHKDGDLGLPAGSDSYENMQQRLRSGYLAIADSLDAPVAPVGWAWRFVRNDDDKIELYSGDNYHPNLNGSYLAAATFFATIFHQSAVGVNYYATLNSSLATYLQTAASSIFLDSINLWNTYSYNSNPHAIFNYNINGLSTDFTNLSTLADSFYWDFGDGQMSHITNPQHTYQDSGWYQVSLIASNDCNTDTQKTNLHITTPNSINYKTPNYLNFNIFPNPTYTDIKIKSNHAIHQMVNIQVTDNLGKIIKLDNLFLNAGETNYSLNNLKTGVYFIKITLDESFEIHKVIKY